MSDAFDFDSLKGIMPKYLGMDSLKDALPKVGDGKIEDTSTVDHTQSMAIDEELPTDLGDVSMADQELEDIEDSRQSGQEFENHDAYSDHNGCGNSMNLKHPEHNTESHSDYSSFQKIISPTQYGAQRALRNRDHAFDVDATPSTNGPSSGLESSTLNTVSQPETCENLTNNPQEPGQIEVYSDHPLNMGRFAPGNNYYEIKMPIPAPWQENLPYILSTYLQVAFNATLLIIFAYVVNIIKHDASKKVEERRARLVRDATWCQYQYVLNDCGTGKAPPHLMDTKVCLDLEHCMETSPDSVRWISMYASLLAEVINEFVQPLKLRTIFSLLAALFVVFALVFGVNYIFGFVRARTYFTSMDQERRRGRRSISSSSNASSNDLKISAEHQTPNSRIWRRHN